MHYSVSSYLHIFISETVQCTMLILTLMCSEVEPHTAEN